MQKLYVNGTILTMEAENDTAEAVLTEDGYIRCAGSREEVLRAAAPDAQEIDLQGRTMMPAFIDGHSHITMAMQMSQAADLTECEDFDEMIRLLRAYKEENGITSEGLISGFGYDHNFLPGGSHPVKKYLNQVSAEIPVYVSHVSGHMGCANDAALKLAGITRDTPDPEGGRIGRLENGEPDGYLEENISVPDYTETELITDAFNKMLARVKALDDSRQEFVSNVSHELKTPLTSMKVLADSLVGQENVPIELYQEFMQDITEEIDRENKIITDLLSLVKLDKKAADLNIETVNINNLLELILKRLKPIAAKNHIELILDSFRPVNAEIDEVKLTLAITNLVENAIKYNVENGWVRVSLNADHKYFYVTGADSGIGIPEESLNHIFERFYRVDKSHSREIGGTGLGLAITRSAIVMHRGAIKVYSKENEGTTFSVRIPLIYIA